MNKQILTLIESAGISALLKDRVEVETRNATLVEELKDLYAQKQATEYELRKKISAMEEEIIKKFGLIADNNAIIETNMEATRRLLPIGKNINDRA